MRRQHANITAGALNGKSGFIAAQPAWFKGDKNAFSALKCDA
jgi:hypothetical protein